MGVKIVVRQDLDLGVWEGLGGAITEAAAYNFFNLKPNKRRKLLNAYFGKNGLDYRWARISVGSNDFCLDSYEYSHKRDLSDFSIEHDKQYVLPLLKEIGKIKAFRVVASSWSPPSSMKTNGRLRFGGRLWPFYYQKYAKYLKKWLKSYEKEGIRVKYLIPQNEPFATQIWESCRYSFRAQRRLAYRYLARELSGIDVQLLLWDHNKAKLSKVARKLVRKGECSRERAVAGLCYHWYDGTCADEMWQVRQEYPDIVMLSSEMCCGFSTYNAKKWQKDANSYIFELFSDINCGSSAFIDWNILLDWHGGPSYCKNYVKSPIILNEAGDDFILTPIYKTLLKFAKAFPVGSKVLRCDNSSKTVVSIARKVEKGCEVVLANTSNGSRVASIVFGEKMQKVTLRPSEIKKIVFKN